MSRFLLRIPQLVVVVLVLLLLSAGGGGGGTAATATVVVREYTLVVSHHAVDVVTGRIVVEEEDGANNANANNNNNASSTTRLASFVNGTLPGPTLEADAGDFLVVTVINKMSNSDVTVGNNSGTGTGAPLTIHWHGQHQVGTNYYDGVQGITQCGLYGENGGGGDGDNDRNDEIFVYRFVADPAGTHLYHAHSLPYQSGDGVFGALVVCDPRNDPYYTGVGGGISDDVVVGFSDWLRYYSTEVYEMLSVGNFDALATDTFFINGKSGSNRDDGVDEPFIIDVSSGGTYRLRLYAMGVEYNFRVSAAGHNMTVIAADGQLVRPTTVDALELFSGERYDVLLVADRSVGGVYEFRADVLDYTGSLTGQSTSGWIRYDAEDSPRTTVESIAKTNVTILDPYELRPYVDATTGEFSSGYRPIQGPANVLEGENRLVYHTTSMSIPNNTKFASTDCWDYHLNVMPSSTTTPLFFSAPLDEDGGNGINGTVRQQTEIVEGATYANSSVTHPIAVGTRIQQLSAGQVVDVIFQNGPADGSDVVERNLFFGGSHPNHLHGHYYWVLGRGTGAFDASVDADKLNFVDPTLRDTIVVRPESWTAVRIHATNPGAWLFHCHSVAHLAFGMATVLYVGDPQTDWPAVPGDLDRTCVSGSSISNGGSEGDDDTSASASGSSNSLRSGNSFRLTCAAGVLTTAVALVVIL